RVGERDESEADDERGQPCRQRERKAGGGDGEGEEGESPPADSVGECAERRPEDAEQPECEDGATGSRPEGEGRLLEAVDDIRERPDEGEEERAACCGRPEQAAVAQLAPDTAPATPSCGWERQVDERAAHHERR